MSVLRRLRGSNLGAAIYSRGGPWRVCRKRGLVLLLLRRALARVVGVLLLVLVGLSLWLLSLLLLRLLLRVMLRSPRGRRGVRIVAWDVGVCVRCRRLVPLRLMLLSILSAGCLVSMPRGLLLLRLWLLVLLILWILLALMLILSVLLLIILLVLVLGSAAVAGPLVVLVRGRHAVFAESESDSESEPEAGSGVSRKPEAEAGNYAAIMLQLRTLFFFFFFFKLKTCF